MDLGDFGTQVLGVFLDQVLFEKGRILKELSTKMKGATGSAILVDNGVVVDPLWFHLCFLLADGYGSPVRIGSVLVRAPFPRLV